jgi:glycosyltransferase involved in cell wall biosynthesis
LLRLGVGWTIRHARRVITVSEFSKARLMKAYGIPEHKIHVIYNAAGPEFEPAWREGMGCRPPYIVMVGDLSARKNQLNLIRAFSAFACRYPHHLLLAGRDSATSDPIREEARVSGVGERIRFLGYVSDEELPRLYQQADLCVYPSLYEGFGLPVVEAMACGTPVVTSRVSALPEVAGGAAVLADPEDPRDLFAAMEAALRDRDRWRRAGLLRARQFSWGEAARRTLEAYRECCVTVRDRARPYRTALTSAPEQEPCESTRSKVDLGVS